METWLQVVISIVGAVMASSGFWALMQKLSDKKDVRTQMLVGLGHDRIMYLGMKYLQRGNWITKEEYENLHDYLYVPYEKLHGNGSAAKMMKEVDSKLYICESAPINPGEKITCKEV